MRRTLPGAHRSLGRQSRERTIERKVDIQTRVGRKSAVAQQRRETPTAARRRRRSVAPTARPLIALVIGDGARPQVDQIIPGLIVPRRGTEIDAVPCDHLAHKTKPVVTARRGGPCEQIVQPARQQFRGGGRTQLRNVARGHAGPRRERRAVKPEVDDRVLVTAREARAYLRVAARSHPGQAACSSADVLPFSSAGSWSRNASRTGFASSHLTLALNAALL